MITFLIIAIISFIFLSCVFKNNTYLANGAFSSVIACVITIIVNVAFFATTRHTMGEYVENKTYKIAECDIMSNSDIIKTDNNCVYSQKELSKNTSFRAKLYEMISFKSVCFERTSHRKIFRIIRK